MNNTQYQLRSQFMNSNIRHLIRIASKQSKTIIGLMSGTSLDGLDIALCEIKGAGSTTSLSLSKFVTVSYPDEVVKKLGAVASAGQVSLEEVCVLHAWLGSYHAGLVLETLKSWNIGPDEVDCLASHGQTLFHAPALQHQQKEMPNSTLQIGDGDHIARRTGILTISDFRQKHVAAGGEGAPLAGLVDELLFKDPKNDRILLNIGGIANYTLLRASGEQGRMITDTGPGNTLINAAMQRFFNKPFDRDGKVASKGKVSSPLLRMMKSHPYFGKPDPKTTGPELFNLEWVKGMQEASGTTDMSPGDLVATLTRFSAETIAESIKQVAGEPLPDIYMSGGGMHNKQLITWISEVLGGPDLKSFEEIGFNPDAKEAVCFAVLANETLSGRGFLIGSDNLPERKVSLGKISLPD